MEQFTNMLWADMMAFSQRHPLYNFVPKLAIAVGFLYCLAAHGDELRAMGRGLLELRPLSRLRERIAPRCAAAAWCAAAARLREAFKPLWRPMLHGFLFCVLLIGSLLAAANYFDFARFRYGAYLNAYEFYHYYLGSKYAPELGYTRLYAASLIADQETGMKWNDSRKQIRNLDTGRYVASDAVLRDAEEYKAHFSEHRWEEWKKDIRWFKSKLITGRWNNVLRDKGYNPSPVWSMVVGGALTNQISTDSERGMLFLALLDLFLIGAAFLCVCWAFGPRAGLFMIMLIGTHYMMRFSHMKGALLRTDFAMCLVMAICMLKKNRYATAGALMAYSVLARIFPAILLFGLGAKLFWEMGRLARAAVDRMVSRYGFGGAFWARTALIAAPLIAAAAILSGITGEILPALTAWLDMGIPVEPRTLAIALFIPMLVGVALCAAAVWGWWKGLMNTRYLRFFGAFAATVLILVGASIAHFGGTELWEDFGSKIGRHNRDISPWRVGFKYIFIAHWRDDLSFRQGVGELRDYLLGRDQEQKTAAARQRGMQDVLRKLAPVIRSAIYRENQGLWWSIQAIVLFLCLIAVKGLKDHQALAFSFAPFFFMTAPTYYYYIMLAAPLILFTSELERPTRALGLAWMFFTAMAGYYFYAMWRQEYATYYWLSWMNCVLAVYIILLGMGETFYFSRRVEMPSPMPPDKGVAQTPASPVASEEENAPA